jgi:hypothetical protein
MSSARERRAFSERQARAGRRGSPTLGPVTDYR